uniref:Uncharacterized protein n=1 Tax=Anguilla anguilla TaxID=7936 RepID=A0A0E9TQM9_ANGAN
MNLEHRDILKNRGTEWICYFTVFISLSSSYMHIMLLLFIECINL